MDIRDKQIQDLKDRLESEIVVKKNEVLINAEYKIIIEKLEMQVALLNELNDKLYNKIAELRYTVKDLTVKNIR
jgi:hypothetical protein